MGNELAGVVGVKKKSMNNADGPQLLMTTCIPVPKCIWMSSLYRKQSNTSHARGFRYYFCEAAFVDLQFNLKLLQCTGITCVMYL